VCRRATGQLAGGGIDAQQQLRAAMQHADFIPMPMLTGFHAVAEACPPPLSAIFTAWVGVTGAFNTASIWPANAGS